VADDTKKIRIWFQGATDRAQHSAYITRLEAHLGRLVEPTTVISFNTTSPPATTTHALTEFRIARNIIKSAVAAERDGWDAVAITHFQDAGLAEAKSVAKIPVMGLGETTLTYALTLGRKLGLVTINPAFVPWHEDQLLRYGLGGRSAGVRAVDCRVSDFMDAFAEPGGRAAEELKVKFEHQAKALLEAGADVIVPAGGLPMLMFGAVHKAAIDGAPVVDGLAILAKMTETAVRLQRISGIEVSRRSNYAHPPDVALQEFLEHG
jgi:allantoin racemase